MNAETSVVELETLPSGSPWAERLASGTSLVAAELAAAESIAFPAGAPPITANLIAQYTYFTGRFGAVNYGAQCSDLHGRAMIDNPELAAMLRSPECLEDVGAATVRYATPSSHLETHESAQCRAASAAIATYKRAIAGQLAELDGPLGAAARTIVKCTELDARFAAAKQRLEQAAVAEVARIEGEHRAASAATTERRAAEAQP